MVEWKKLGDVCEIQRGVRVIRKDLDEGGAIPVFQNSLIPLGFYHISNYPKNTPFVISAGAAGDIGYSTIPFWAADDCLCLSDCKELISKYAYYYLLVKQPLLKSRVRKASVPRLSRTEVENIIIPIPSLSEQSRIVSILDTFTASIENLKEQIAERRKQYDVFLDKLYYANKSELLEASKKGDVQVKTLDEIGTFTRGKRFVRNDIVEEGVPCIHYGDMYTYYGVWSDKTPTYLTRERAEKLRFAQNGDVVIVGAGENDIDIGVGVAWLGEEDAVVHDACYIFKHEMNPKYLSYFMRSMNYHMQIRMGVVDGKICSISAKELGRTLTPVPSLEAQSRIVSILDTFEASIANLEEQLELRQKQYEYYRNQLLSFE